MTDPSAASEITPVDYSLRTLNGETYRRSYTDSSRWSRRHGSWWAIERNDTVCAELDRLYPS